MVVWYFKLKGNGVSIIPPIFLGCISFYCYYRRITQHCFIICYDIIILDKHGRFHFKTKQIDNKSSKPTWISESERKTRRRRTWKNPHPKRKKSLKPRDLGRRTTEYMNTYQSRKLLSCAQLDTLDLQVS